MSENTTETNELDPSLKQDFTTLVEALVDPEVDTSDIFKQLQTLFPTFF